MPTALSDVDLEQALFAIGAVLSGALTVLAYNTGDDIGQQFLFLAFTTYLAGAALPAARERVPEYKRTGAIALGGVGAVTYFAGTSSALPLLFVIGGVAAYLRLF